MAVSRSRLFSALALSFALGAGGAWLVAGGIRPGPDTHCAAGGLPMRRVELVFGLSRKGRTDISESDWSAFLDREVTPRFPDGLTVLAGQGQWRNAAGVAIKEPSRLLLVWAKPVTDLEARIDAVREAWKRAHDQESVLRADGWNCVAF